MKKNSLRLLGWVFIPYVMVFVYWKRMQGSAKFFGITWAVISLISSFGNLSGAGSEQATETAALVENKADVDKEAAAAAKKKAAEEKKKAEEAKRKAEEAEYNKPENVYARWIDAQFSPWDGSATALKDAIKENMNDPKSFKHVKTTYSDKGNMKGIDVYMTFRGANAFGATVLNQVHASFDYKTGIFTYEMVN